MDGAAPVLRTSFCGTAKKTQVIPVRIHYASSTLEFPVSVPENLQVMQFKRWIISILMENKLDNWRFENGLRHNQVIVYSFPQGILNDYQSVLLGSGRYRTFSFAGKANEPMIHVHID